MIKHFIYCRKSTEEEERQILSIEAQLTELRQFAKQNDLLIVKEFVETRTAKEPGRPVFNQMLDEIETGLLPHRKNPIRSLVQIHKYVHVQRAAEEADARKPRRSKRSVQVGT